MATFLIRAIRDQEEGRSHRTLAIAITGFAGRQDHETALRAGFDEHVAKPVEPDDLLRPRARACGLSDRNRKPNVIVFSPPASKRSRRCSFSSVCEEFLYLFRIAR